MLMYQKVRCNKCILWPTWWCNICISALSSSAIFKALTLPATGSLYFGVNVWRKTLNTKTFGGTPPHLDCNLVAHDCGYPLSRYTCRATRVAADFQDFRAFCRCSTCVALHPLKILVSHLPPPPRAGRCRTEIWVWKVSRYTGVSQLQLRVSRYTVPHLDCNHPVIHTHTHTKIRSRRAGCPWRAQSVPGHIWGIPTSTLTAVIVL